MRLRETLSAARTAIWHLRNGGVNDLIRWRQRHLLDKARPSASANPKRSRFRWAKRSSDLVFEPATPSARKGPFREVRAAVILDDFSALAFGFEWESVAVTPEGWVGALSENVPDLLFVESAWAGNGGAWKFKLTGNSGPAPELRSLVEWCRSREIPTVFWNKEDPPHYADFLEAAMLFDVVFTSDRTRIEYYQRDLGHDRVFVLPFAAQPAVHNPIRPSHGWHDRDVAFAGMYFGHKYPERRGQLDYLLGGAVAASSDMLHGLEIFSRMLGGDARYQFPATYASHVVGQLPYEQMLTAYKAYKIFLNANSVVDSPSMCARRIFEISASGTPVVTAPSTAIREFFPANEIHIASDFEETRHLVRALARNSDLGERSVHLAQRRIWREHTYSHRVQTVLAAAGKKVTLKHPSVSCLVSTNRPQQLDHVFAQFGRQSHEEKQLVVLTHGFQPDDHEKLRLARANLLENVRFIEAPKSIPLGSCLNLLIEAADGEILSKMDDDDIYGTHYLEDLVNAYGFSGADIVGKGAHYMSLTGPRVLLRRFRNNEHRFVRHVMGPTITGNREVFRSIRFAALERGEDTDFLARAVVAGSTIYAADRFNFVQVRKGHDHTWHLSDMEALGLGEVEVHGDFSDHVFL